MSNQLTAFAPFGDQLPAFLVQAYEAQTNSDLTAHASVSFPVISIKGKVFTKVSDGTREIIANPKDPDSPATAILAVIVKSSPYKSKVFYANGYNPDASGDDAKPTCFSNNGKTPDASISSPQCKTCAACKWNMFGTSRGDNGSVGKGKACSDSVRIAICTISDPDTVYMLRVPAASIKNLGAYGTVLRTRRTPYNSVVTKISFDVNEATPRLMFEPAGVITDQALYNRIVSQANSEVVDHIINGGSSHTESDAPSAPVAPAATPKTEQEKAQAEVTKAAAKIVEVVAAAPATPKVAETSAAQALIDSVMAEPAAEKKPAAKRSTKKAQVVDSVEDGMAAELDSMFDD